MLIETMDLLGVMVVVFVGMVTVVRIVRVRRQWRRKEEEHRRCVCGYRLQGLEVPRCPECGRAVGFEVGFAELGISEEEMRAGVKRRREGRLTTENTEGTETTGNEE